MPLSPASPYSTMQFLCSSLSSKCVSYLIPQNQQNIAQNLYFIKCAVLTLVLPPFWFHLHKIQNPIFQLGCYLNITRGIERFSARKYFSKILQVGHFHLGFSPCKNNNEMIHSHRVLLKIVDLYFENTNETL